ncbi:MAG: KpsF/GutQ family sugar-phosphate isomerase [Rhodobacteraceae bacterium]|nr:KpsF/GutQ family sugar-phosphate isomerase [Paracoccaceae bacterium]
MHMVDKAASVSEVIAVNATGVSALQNALQDPEMTNALEAALDLIAGMKGRLIVAGVGKSGLIGRKLAATFASTGTPAFFVHPAEASHGDLGMIQTDDVVLMLSWSGETRELSDILMYTRRFAVATIAITGKSNSTLAQKADVALVLPLVQEACPHNLAPTTSTLLQLALGDALAITLLKMKGFTEESFRDFHPGGKLGSALTPVSDIMYSGDKLPLVSEKMPIMQVVGEISKKTLGIVGVQNSGGDLIGVITDGDIRRYLEANSSGSMKQAMLETFAESIMTESSITLEPQRLSARALNVLQKNKISAAFVLDNGKPVGLVTLMQLLQRGVA